MPGRKTTDPDVKCGCLVCCGPVYVDEPGTTCPDCRDATETLRIIHEQDAKDAQGECLSDHKRLGICGRAAPRNIATHP